MRRVRQRKSFFRCPFLSGKDIAHLGPFVQGSLHVRDLRPAGTAPEEEKKAALGRVTRAQTENLRPADGDITVSAELEIKLHGRRGTLRRS